MNSIDRSYDLSLVYITAPDVEAARKLARTLVDERLAACVNVLGPVESTYRWKGNVESGQEIALIAKTKQSLVEALVCKVREIHSYEVPCVISLPIFGGNPDFLDWVRSETR